MFYVHWEKFGPQRHLLVGVYVPIIIDDIQRDPEKRHVLLHALYEIITRYTQKQCMYQIWTLLFDDCESEDEGTRNADAECFGKLTLATP
ncbi:Cullin-associated NEDD8-dissociated protein 1 [Mortierella antarctica]|nr:Cullin-associated NEDD8-dissociated protein 1 [Mortierella antarctica]